MVVMAFSRWREFRADDGGARLAGRGAMIAALRRLGQGHLAGELPREMAAFGISGSGGRAMARLLMSHPPIEERIARLEAGGR